MPASEARIQANRQNALKSTGPKTPEGKERSRGNAFKHGLTGQGIILPEADHAEVRRRAAAFVEELDARGEAGLALARRAALDSVRMERAADQQAAALQEKVLQVMADFTPPEGVDQAEAERLLAEAARRAMFDTSKEAALVRKYEAAAERSFFRSLKELRQMRSKARALDPAAQERAFREELASYLKASEQDDEIDEFLDRHEAKRDLEPLPTPNRGASVPVPPRPSASGTSFELPFSIGRPR